MIIPASVTDSIAAAGIDVSADWLSSSTPVWNADYSAILTQPISIAVTPLADMRFLSVTTATITIRVTSGPTSLVSWSGIATLVADGTTGGVTSFPVHNTLTGRDAADTHPLASITDLVDALASAGGDNIEAFPRGNIVWQADPGDLWDSGLCFVQMFSTLDRVALTHIDLQFGTAGSGADGGWAVWGGVDATGVWTLLAQGLLPNATKGVARIPLVTPLDLTLYDSVALAQDPGAAGVTQPVRQASAYYSPNPPSGIAAAYAYLGTHVHGAAFTTLPVIPANDATYLMQKWSSIGVR